jgi:hypothetical protein
MALEFETLLGSPLFALKVKAKDGEKTGSKKAGPSMLDLIRKILGLETKNKTRSDVNSIKVGRLTKY